MDRLYFVNELGYQRAANPSPRNQEWSATLTVLDATQVHPATAPRKTPKDGVQSRAEADLQEKLTVENQVGLTLQ
ncbi:MAG: hypothetical protein MUF49_18810 [Oculatellaceae cyanobacterium Prado106]|nr:hypothetical protein [Oculatellaceae cyanobacterium Prado106]